jgi:DNA-binding IclR family transcriptional regulator
MASTESNKAKIARRVIEVLEFFDEEHPRATVMDIVRRFNRPQSSTSELLSSLVDLGLLYKDPYSRSYCPTPRAAMLGTAVQPGLIRDGRLTGVIDRLCAQTGLGVAIFGMVGLKLQIFSWRAGKRALRTAGPAGFCGGLQEELSASAAGWLMLSTVEQPRRDGMIRRLNAETSEDRKFQPSDMISRVQLCRDRGHATGPAGFGSIGDTTAMLVPGQPEGQPLAIGIVYEPSESVDAVALTESLADALACCMEQPEAPAAEARPLFFAA